MQEPEERPGEQVQVDEKEEPQSSRNERRRKWRPRAGECDYGLYAGSS
jgi:hypothetical protein